MGFAFRESDVLTACLNYLALRGVFAWRSNNTGVYDATRKCYRAFRGLKGVADILGIVPRCVSDGTHGLFLAIEVKRAGNKTSHEQECFLTEVQRLGGLAFCVRSVQELEDQLAPHLGDVPDLNSVNFGRVI